MAKPSIPPKMVVIITIGSNDAGSFQPIRIAAGSKTKYENRIPFNMAFIFSSVTESIKPIITHIRKAEMLASHERFWIIIGMTSIIPAAAPRPIPVIIFLFIVETLDCYFQPMTA